MSKIDKVLDEYGSRVYKQRKTHILETNGQDQEIMANSRSIPGIMTNRGCCYAGGKGVVLAPISDVCCITHGPIGCGYYSWGTRRNKALPSEGKNFVEYCVSTDMQEADIVFGGEKKLRQVIKEVVEIFDPKCIMICSTCPIGLIGDDIHAVAAEASKLYDRQVLAYSCEGYKGVSQSGGHHIANNSFMRDIIGTNDRPATKTFSVNILGEYNIGGDGWEIDRLLKRIGYDVVASLPGDGKIDDIRSAHEATLNIVQCHRSINYVAEMMKEKYNIDWIKVNFIGVQATIDSLRDMAKYFGDEELTQRTEDVIRDEVALIADEMAHYKSKLKGKTAALFVGGSRSHHYQKVLEDLGMETILAGYEFGHREDYEGDKVKGTIKEDADSKNIESITVTKDPDHYKMYLTEEQYQKLREEMPTLNNYDGMIPDMGSGQIIVDDLNHYETEMFLKILKPDVFFSGIKDKYVSQKGGVLSRQLHSYDYSGPYAGFTGARNFARDVAMGISTPAWGYIRAPWKVTPTLEGKVVGGEASC